jgi:hypothetical protein
MYVDGNVRRERETKEFSACAHHIHSLSMICVNSVWLFFLVLDCTVQLIFLLPASEAGTLFTSTVLWRSSFCSVF